LVLQNNPQQTIDRMKKYIWILFLLFSLFSCKKEQVNLQRITATRIPVDETKELNKAISTVIAPYKETLEVEMNEVLAYAPTDYYKSRNSDKAETSIGNFLADLCYSRGNPIFKKQAKKNIDFVLLNFGGIRAGIPKGAVTVRNAYEVMPFENSMVVVELSYEKLLELFSYLAKSSKAHPVSSQLQINFKGEEIQSVRIHGKPLNPKSNYFVLTSDYLQHGGDRMNFFKEPVGLYNLDYKIRNAILDKLKVIDTIQAVEDGRMIRK